MTREQCDCGCNPPHSDPSMCARNRATTKEYQQRMTQSFLRGGDKLRDEHYATGHPSPVYGCPACPLT